jgi:poly(3-hydroxybutyrate) depolymerase
VLPWRRYRLYLPRGTSRATRAPLVVLLHGCRQTAGDFAHGTRIEAAADRAGVRVAMPDQKDRANPWRCWNWFDARTVAGKGEAAIVAAIVRKVTRRYAVDRDRIVVAGLSSGAALAAIVGVRYPGLVRGVFTHAGLACDAAETAFMAPTAMRRGPQTDVAAVALAARARAGSDVSVALVAVHGGDDDVVARLNVEALARQYLALDGVDVPPGGNVALPPPASTERTVLSSTRSVRTRAWQRGGRELVRIVEVAGLGHAWSGGDPAWPFHAAGPPDATAMLVDWAATLER